MEDGKLRCIRRLGTLFEASDAAGYGKGCFGDRSAYIAFLIGLAMGIADSEHFEISEYRKHRSTVGWMGSMEALGGNCRDE